jgi:hypothetical protein
VSAAGGDTEAADGVQPQENEDMRLTIGVMGSSGGKLPKDTLKRVRRLGEAIAEHEAILITGGCPGLPHAAARGAKAKGGLVVGISPGLSLEEHRGKYGSPVDRFDVLIYTGSGLMGREILYDDDPSRLIGRLIEYHRTKHLQKPSCFCDAPEGEGPPSIEPRHSRPLTRRITR